MPTTPKPSQWKPRGHPTTDDAKQARTLFPPEKMRVLLELLKLEEIEPDFGKREQLGKH